MEEASFSMWNSSFHRVFLHMRVPISFRRWLHGEWSHALPLKYTWKHTRMHVRTLTLYASSLTHTHIKNYIQKHIIPHNLHTCIHAFPLFFLWKYDIIIIHANCCAQHRHLYYFAVIFPFPNYMNHPDFWYKFVL